MKTELVKKQKYKNNICHNLHDASSKVERNKKKQQRKPPKLQLETKYEEMQNTMKM